MGFFVYFGVVFFLHGNSLILRMRQRNIDWSLVLNYTFTADGLERNYHDKTHFLIKSLMSFPPPYNPGEIHPV